MDSEAVADAKAAPGLHRDACIDSPSLSRHCFVVGLAPEGPRPSLNLSDIKRCHVADGVFGGRAE